MKDKIINLTDIENYLKSGNISKLSKATGIPYRTLENWKAENNKWLSDVITRLTGIQEFLDGENNEN